MSSFLCFVCHSTVNADTNEDTREKYREVIGMHLCPDSHLCFICCHFLNKMCLFKSICLKRSLEYPVLFSEKGTINLQRSDITVSILCPKDICLQHLNTRCYIYDKNENSQSDCGENNYCELHDDINCDVNESLLKTELNKEFHQDFIFHTKDNDKNLFNDEVCLPNIEAVRITQSDSTDIEWSNNDINKLRKDTVLLELDKYKNEPNVLNIECTNVQEMQDKIDDNLNPDYIYENIVNENSINKDKETNDSHVVNNIIENIENYSNCDENDSHENSVDYNENDSENGDYDNNEEIVNPNSHLESIKEESLLSCNESKYPLENLRLEDENFNKSKKKKCKKKEFENIKLSVKEQKMELEQARKEEKYISASFKCYNCAIHFHFKDSYQAHMMRHEESNGEYYCPICTLRFANPAVLRSHSSNHAERYRCTRCGHVLRARQRQTHLRACRGKGTDSVACHLCGNVFQGPSHFQQHLKRFHQSKSSNRSYLCNVCGASYNNRAAVRTHMITHINRKFSCEQCSSTFSSPYTLNQHKKKHSPTEQQLHHCVSCRVSYNSRKSLLAHRRNALAHKDTVYKCAVCDRSCPSLRSLRSHSAAVHARTNHLICNVCPNRYSTKKALVRHMACHKTDPRKQTPLCHACGETFKSTSILKRHLKNVCEKDKTEELNTYYEQ